jgi:RNA polymerase sigma-70 factor (ECF subfamily)
MPLDAEEVIRRYGPFVWRVLRHHGVAPEHLEDLSQEVFLLVVRKIDEFEARSSCSTWLYGICRNVARDARRAGARRPEHVTDLPTEIAAREAQTGDLERKRAWACVTAALQRLPEPTRMVFVLFELERMEMETVAQTLGCGSSTAYSRLYAARAHVRAALERADLIEPNQEIAEVV